MLVQRIMGNCNNENNISKFARPAVLTKTPPSLRHSCSLVGRFSDKAPDCWTPGTGPRHGGGPSYQGDHSPPPRTPPRYSPPQPARGTSPRRWPTSSSWPRFSMWPGVTRISWTKLVVVVSILRSNVSYLVFLGQSSENKIKLMVYK